jgi:diguanylate cyclase (GGDEF)-like protein
MAEIFRRTFRQSDVVARLGGDEFVMLALDTSGDEGATIRRRLSQNLEEANREPGLRYRLSVSLGILSFDARQEEPLGALLARADRALYREKRSRRGTTSSVAPGAIGLIR